MGEEGKNKIHIKPKKPGVMPKSNLANKDLEDLKREVKNFKKQIGRLLNIAEHEENIVEEFRGKQVTLKLVDGSQEIGELKDITKFQIIIEQAGLDQHYYKSAVIRYHF